MAGKKKSGGSVDFKVTASGLNKVDKDAKKAGKSFSQLDKNASSADRAGKGVAQMSSNVTKNFSKMSQGITGGLVPAYATLAANIFAATAAFGALQRAAQFEKLLQGFEAIAATTGRTSSIIVQSLKDITDGALSTEQAASSAAAGINAGFSTSNLYALIDIAPIE